MTRVFRPPDTPSEVRDQLVRLHDGLLQISKISPLGEEVTAGQVAEKVNEIIWRLGLLTRNGDARRKPTSVSSI
jgi:hypothetical protein